MNCNTLQPLNMVLRILFLAVLIVGSGLEISSQVVVDKTVATVSDGLRTELITYSDLR